MREESALAGTRRGSWRRSGTKTSCSPWAWCPGPLPWSSLTKKKWRKLRRRRRWRITRRELQKCQTSSGQQWKSISQIVSIEQRGACLFGSAGSALLCSKSCSISTPCAHFNVNIWKLTLCQGIVWFWFFLLSLMRKAGVFQRWSLQTHN